MLSLSTISQNTYPKLIKHDKDTVVAFTVPQSKIIAKNIEDMYYFEALNQEYVKKDSVNNKIINNLDNQIVNYKAELKNTVIIDSSRVKQIDNLNCLNAIQKKQIKVEKRKKNLAIAGAVIVAILGAYSFLTK